MNEATLNISDKQTNELTNKYLVAGTLNVVKPE